jgi:hypothetical protein
MTNYFHSRNRHISQIRDAPSGARIALSQIKAIDQIRSKACDADAWILRWPEQLT